VTGNNTQVWFSTTQNPTHSFGVGNYSITLNASNSAGYNLSVQTTFINVTTAIVAPVASFIPNTMSGTAPLTVTFTDTSTNSPTTWNWSFRNVTGNNTQVWFSTSRNPTHTFGVGNYSIVLNASNSAGYSLSAQTTFINVLMVAPIASFTPNISSGAVPLTVTFTDTSTNTPTAWNWSFRNVTGNNTQIWFSTSRNPTKTFGVGNYSIVLNASNSGGYSLSVQTSFINVTSTVISPVAIFTPSAATGTSPLSVTFTDISTNTPTAWNWSFRNVTGNNTQIWFSTSQNPTHTFGVGNYSIVLNASNSVGYSLSAQTTFINVTAVPVVVVNASPTTGVYRPVIGFYLKWDNGSTWNPSTDKYLAWDNAAGDLPIAGDWNTDGRTETGVYRPGVGFFLKMDNGSSWNPSSDVYLAWDNAAVDRPVAGDWNADGRTETGVYRPGAGFYLKMDNSSTWNPSTDVYLAWDNAAGDLPIAGNFG
jgi:PKD repeat protein